MSACCLLHIGGEQITRIYVALVWKAAFKTKHHCSQYFSADLIKLWVVCWSNYTSEDWNESQFVTNVDMLAKAPHADSMGVKLIESRVRQE